MSAAEAGLIAHLKSGATSTCRCWRIERLDGQVLGFTDHDEALDFDGTSYVPSSGLSAKALEQSTGLAVDNTEAVGVLSADHVSEADIVAGRYDGAAVVALIVNWANTAERKVLFRGTIGEIRRGDVAFEAELRGLADPLNVERSKVYQRSCDVGLGDAGCGVDMTAPGMRVSVPVLSVESERAFTIGDIAGMADRWFERGRAEVMDGAASGHVGFVKRDRIEGAVRRIELWEDMRAVLAPGDFVQLDAGCDKSFETCRVKFDNAVNFRGFPHIPGDEWITSIPRKGRKNDGGSLIK